jgi:hypothetical protein
MQKKKKDDDDEEEGRKKEEGRRRNQGKEEEEEEDVTIRKETGDLFLLFCSTMACNGKSKKGGKKQLPFNYCIVYTYEANQ